MEVGKKLGLVIFVAVVLLVCFYVFYLRGQVNIPLSLPQSSVSADEHLQMLRVAEGYQVDFFIPPDGRIDNPRQIAVADDGWVFIGSREGTVYAAKDSNNDGQADRIRRVADNLNVPHGVAFHSGKLYIGTVSTIYVVDNIIAKLSRPTGAISLTPFIEGLPDSSWHGTRHIKVGPDRLLYVSLGTPCDICLPPDKDLTGVIRRYDLNGENGQVYARGIRNSVGFDWHPTTGDLWFTDNGRDWMGDDLPSDELNRVGYVGQHFGYPYCHQGNLPDPEFGKQRKCSEFTAPEWLTGPHVANLGIAFDPTGDYAYIALHGSWNRSEKIGYAVYRAYIRKNKVSAFTPFVDGWLKADGKVLGRPADIDFTSDGDMLITDDFADSVYRVRKRR